MVNNNRDADGRFGFKPPPRPKPLIERVARWLCEQEHIQESYWRDHTAKAIELIELIRQPTDRMHRRASVEFPKGSPRGDMIWRAMVDAALEEKE